MRTSIGHRMTMQRYRDTHKREIAASTERRKGKVSAYQQTGKGKAALSAGVLNTRAKEKGLPGRVSAEDILSLGLTCRHCGETGTEIDHKRAISLGGEHTKSNLIRLCAECHKEKTRKERAFKVRGEPLPVWITELTSIESPQMCLFT